MIGVRLTEGKRRKSSPAPRRLGAPPSLKNIKYTTVRHLKKISTFLSKRTPRECFPGPAVALMSLCAFAKVEDGGRYKLTSWSACLLACDYCKRPLLPGSVSLSNSACLSVRSSAIHYKNSEPCYLPACLSACRLGNSKNKEHISDISVITLQVTQLIHCVSKHGPRHYRS